MTTEVTYIVRRAFDYGGVRYEQGDTWEPLGSRWDDSIIANKLVTTVRVKKSRPVADTGLKAGSTRKVAHGAESG